MKDRKEEIHIQIKRLEDVTRETKIAFKILGKSLLSSRVALREKMITENEEEITKLKTELAELEKQES